MKIAGIICEYNPFHSGHAYQIAETRRRSGCDYVVACMTGSFVQRGEAACLSKQIRAEMALKNGVDAVFELPALYALRTADAFAMGGVTILALLGVDVLSFGCETEDFPMLCKLADLRENEPLCVSQDIQRRLSEGKSYARAQGEAFAESLNVPAELLMQPNLILACEYLRAIQNLNASMQPMMIQRIGDYHASAANGEFASATAVRQLLLEGKLAEAKRYLPESAGDLLENYKGMHHPDELILYRLRNMTDAEIRALPDVSEGLENRLRRAAAEASDYESLIHLMKCKRYTRARLSRLCAYAMLNVTDDLIKRHPKPEYARLIGMRASAKPLLSELKRRSTLPLVANPGEIQNHEVFQLECRAADLRALCCNDPQERKMGGERTHKFVLV